MRSKIEANEYKDYILGFIFYKYLSDQLVEFVMAQGMTDDDVKALSEDETETVKYIQNTLGYFISYNNLFSTWIDPTTDFDESNGAMPYPPLIALFLLIIKNYLKAFLPR